MKYLITVLAVLVTKCASSDLPPPVYPQNCDIPDCSILSNRYHEKATFAHPDPNRYYQCAPYSLWEWKPMERWCICGTVYNPKVSRCSYWWDEGWEPMCDAMDFPPKLVSCERHFDGWVTPPAPIEPEEYSNEYVEENEE